MTKRTKSKFFSVLIASSYLEYCEKIQKPQNTKE